MILHDLRASDRRCGAFTLLEVLIAGGILFVCLFAILGLLSNGLSNARALQQTREDPRASVIANLYDEFTHTNVIYEGSGFGEFRDWKYDWERIQVQSNGLCQVTVVILPAHKGARPQRLDAILYLPQMQQQGFGGGVPR
ncbi:MAG: hypothetical protein U1F98_00035 [Verrucomicrobiota bacterium]